MKLHRLRFCFAVTMLLILTGVAAQAQHWYSYAPPPTEFDWQLFAPFNEGTFDCDEQSPVSEGYFFNIDRLHLWMSRPNTVPVGNDPGNNPVSVFIPNEVDYAYYDIAGNLPITPANDTPLVLLPYSDGGSFGFQFNSVADATPYTLRGWGNRFEFGWVGGEPHHHSGSTGWMISVISGLDMGYQLLLGFDDKRLNQLGAAQGLDGVDGNQDDPNNPVNPVGPVAGIYGIPYDEGLTTVQVFYDDPFNLLLGFADVNGDQVAEDLNNNGILNEIGPVPIGDQIRMGVVYDDATITNSTRVSGVQLSAIRRKAPLHGGAVAEMTLGARFLNLDDRFSFQGRGSVLADTLVNNMALNRVIGPEFGIRIAKQSRRWSTVISGRFMAGANFMSSRQTGYIGDHLTTSAIPNAGNTPGIPLGFGGNEFVNTLRTERFSPTGELRVQGSFNLTRAIRLQAAWEGTVVGGITRSANTNVWSLPSMGLLNRSEDIFMHGVTFGLMVNR